MATIITREYVLSPHSHFMIYGHNHHTGIYGPFQHVVLAHFNFVISGHIHYTGICGDFQHVLNHVPNHFLLQTFGVQSGIPFAQAAIR